MKRTSLATRRTQSYAYSYAKAIFDLAKAEKNIDKVEDDLKLIASTVRSHLKLKAILSDTKVDKDKKKQVVREIFEGKVSPIALYLLDLVVDFSREQLLSDICKDFAKLAHAARSELIVEVTTAIPLNKDQQEKFAKKLSDIMGREVALRSNLDESILGGVVVRVGDKVIDGSVYRKLERLKQQLSAPSTGGGG